MGNCACTEEPHSHKTIDPDMKYLRKRRWSTDLDKPAVVKVASESDDVTEDTPGTEEIASEKSSYHGDSIPITINLPVGDIVIDVNPFMTVRQLKMQISRSSGIILGYFDLIHAGETMKSTSDLVMDYINTTDDTVEAVMSVRAERKFFNCVSEIPSQKEFLFAIMFGDDRLAMELIEKGADLSSRDFESGFTPLCGAITTGNSFLARELLTWNEVLPSTECDWGSPLFIACDRGHLDCVKLLLSTGKVKVNGSFRMCGTPLYISCRNGFTSIVEELLKMNSVSVNKIGKTCIHHHTPLFAAVYNGHIGVVRLLVEHPKIKVNKLSSHAYDMYEHPRAPLDVADNPEMVRLLVEHSAKVSLR